MKKKSSNKPFKQHHTALAEGDKAPNFEAKDQNGNTIRLSDFSLKTLVLYFYPKDNTPTCTTQACNLRDQFKSLSEIDFAVIGVSADNEKSHSKFAAKFALPFPLLADTELSIIKSYDVWGTKQLFGRIYDGIVRTTFVIDNAGFIKKIICDVDSKNHVQQILAD